jgi:tRNA(fMet)-specific endonuclease VapC
VALSLSQLDVLFAALVPVSFDEYAAHHFGQLKAYLEQQGQRLADLDLQIASIALHHHAVLVTHNQRHFSRVDFLQLDDWLA